MAIGALAGAAVGLVPSLFQIFSGMSQRRQANKINPVDPGYQVNNAVINNANVLSNRAGNYQMPGYNQAVGNLNASTANAFNQGVQGATSGGDVLDLATKLAFGQQQQLNQLASRNAAGSEQALMQSLDANAMAGREYQNKNQYDIRRYEDQVRQKAALQQAGTQNMYSGIDTLATVGTTLLNPRNVIDSNQQFTPEQLAAQQAYIKSLGR